jgi:hypothetical protein
VDSEYIENEGTPQTAISPYIARKIVSDFMESRKCAAVVDEHGVGVIEVDPVVFAQYVTYWCRTNGEGQNEAKQVVTGWSKLRVRKSDLPPTDDAIREIKEHGPKVSR